MQISRIVAGGGLLCAASLFSIGASAVTTVYSFTGGGGLNPPGDATTSGWMTENRTSFVGLAPTTVLDNGVVSLAPGNWLDQFGPFDGAYSGTATITDGVLTSGTLSWTGQIGFEATSAPGFPGIGFYAITLVNGSYNLLTGAYTGSQGCAANPAGLAPTACAFEQTGVSNMTQGTTSFVDNGNGTVTLTMASNQFTINGGIKDTVPGDHTGSLGYNSVLRWVLNASIVNPDTDGDGVPNVSDNCRLLSNANQADSNGDGFGNRCDGDLNNNNTTNAQDYVLFRQQLGQPSAAPVYNAADINSNGAVNAQDYVLFRGLLGSPPGPGAGP